MGSGDYTQPLIKEILCVGETAHRKDMPTLHVYGPGFDLHSAYSQAPLEIMPKNELVIIPENYYVCTNNIF